MIYIDTLPEYEYALKRGYEPLLDWRLFTLDINLRISIQQSYFGACDLSIENNRFYHWVWDRSLRYCQETGKQLHNYSSVYISHIISRGSDRRMALDPRNVNILCFESHNMWEFSKLEKKKGMNIYPVNKIVTNLLKNDYNGNIKCYI